MADEIALKRQDAILAVISACRGNPSLGRTALQKLLYFTGIKFGLDFGFEPYYYGPYSSMVESDVGQLVYGGLVRENRELLGFVSDRGFEARRYRYDLSPAGQERLQSVRSVHSAAVQIIEEFVSSVMSAAEGLDHKVLAAAAKTFFIANDKGERLSTDEISEYAKDHDWDLQPRQVEKVADILARLGFVDVTEE